MAITHKAPMSLSGRGSTIIDLNVFKRKRIEQWCKDVAQYLTTGTMCHSVVGDVEPHSTRQHPATDSRRSSLDGSEKSTADNYNNGITTDETDRDGATFRPSSTPSETPEELHVERISFSKYNEQRRRIDRLVQGLPALGSRSYSTAAAADQADNIPVIYVNGEEPVRRPRFGSGSPPDLPKRPATHAGQSFDSGLRSDSRSNSCEQAGLQASLNSRLSLRSVSSTPGLRNSPKPGIHRVNLSPPSENLVVENDPIRLKVDYRRVRPKSEIQTLATPSRNSHVIKKSPIVRKPLQPVLTDSRQCFSLTNGTRPKKPESIVAKIPHRYN